MEPEQLAALREPFPDAAKGHKPRISCKACSQANGRVCQDHRKERCDKCGNWITTAHVDLDYVGHAAVTARLLSVDPEWSWEPFAVGDDGLPAIRNGELWIRLTICGDTRIGVGDAEGKSGPGASKELIGDAIRNAAMRFGVALDLWSKEDLRASASPTISPEDADELLARMNALEPQELRARCKQEFKTFLGDPRSITEDDVINASKLIAEYERQSAAPSAPDGSDVAPEGTEEHSGDPGGESEAITALDDDAITQAVASAVESPPPVGRQYDAEQVNKMPKRELVEALSGLGLSTAGKIDDLRNRLLGIAA